MSEYFLGSSDHELDRLGFQHEVWSGATGRLLDALAVSPGQRVLDLGCGPGFVTEELRRRVGERGEVVAVDAEPRWKERVEAVAAGNGWRNVRAVTGRLQAVELEPGAADAAILRWVLSFQPEPEALLARVAGWVRPGGLVAVMDYNHEGVSLFPRSAGFEAAIAATRASYERHGGDTFVMGRAPALFRAAGLELLGLECDVLAGGPASNAFAWADRFFPFHVGAMVEEGTLSSDDRARFDREWAAHRADPDALFFSPIVVRAVGRRPSDTPA